MKNKKLIILILILVVLIIVAGGVFTYIYIEDQKAKKEQSAMEDDNNSEEEALVVTQKEPKIFAGNDRPIAVMIDNHSGAWPQAGLNKAYLVYEIIVEGGETRLMALFKGQDLDKIGPVRSSRHYFLDYALENDAIYVHHGWSPQAKNDIASLGVDNINGISESSSDFWRVKDKSAPHNLFTSTDSILKIAERKGYATTSEQKSVLNYVANEIDLATKYGVVVDNPEAGSEFEDENELEESLDDEANSEEENNLENKENSAEKENSETVLDSNNQVVLDLSEGATFTKAIIANTVTIPHSSLQTVKYEYDAETKRYTRYARGVLQTDYVTDQDVTTKNIIITFCDNYTLQDSENKGRQGLRNIGTFDGYYITNGYAIPIKCTKDDRESQTVYKDLDGNIIEVSDGNTFINICPRNAKVEIK